MDTGTDWISKAFTNLEDEHEAVLRLRQTEKYSVVSDELNHGTQVGQFPNQVYDSGVIPRVYGPVARVLFSQINEAQESFHSFDQSQPYSLYDLLLERKGRPEDLLYNLGFGTGTSVNHTLSQIPSRFLKQPSSAKGINVCHFLEEHSASLESISPGSPDSSLSSPSNLFTDSARNLILLLRFSNVLNEQVNIKKVAEARSTILHPDTTHYLHEDSLKGPNISCVNSQALYETVDEAGYKTCSSTDPTKVTIGSAHHSSHLPVVIDRLPAVLYSSPAAVDSSLSPTCIDDMEVSRPFHSYPSSNSSKSSTDPYLHPSSNGRNPMIQRRRSLSPRSKCQHRSKSPITSSTSVVDSDTLNYKPVSKPRQSNVNRQRWTSANHFNDPVSSNSSLESVGLVPVYRYQGQWGSVGDLAASQLYTGSSYHYLDRLQLLKDKHQVDRSFHTECIEQEVSDRLYRCKSMEYLSAFTDNESQSQSTDDGGSYLAKFNQMKAQHQLRQMNQQPFVDDIIKEKLKQLRRRSSPSGLKLSVFNIDIEEGHRQVNEDTIKDSGLGGESTLFKDWSHLDQENYDQSHLDQKHYDQIDLYQGTYDQSQLDQENYYQTNFDNYVPSHLDQENYDNGNLVDSSPSDHTKSLFDPNVEDVAYASNGGLLDESNGAATKMDHKIIADSHQYIPYTSSSGNDDAPSINHEADKDGEKNELLNLEKDFHWSDGMDASTQLVGVHSVDSTLVSLTTDTIVTDDFVTHYPSVNLDELDSSNLTRQELADDHSIDSAVCGQYSQHSVLVEYIGQTDAIATLRTNVQTEGHLPGADKEVLLKAVHTNSAMDEVSDENFNPLMDKSKAKCSCSDGSTNDSLSDVLTSPLTNCSFASAIAYDPLHQLAHEHTSAEDSSFYTKCGQLQIEMGNTQDKKDPETLPNDDIKDKTNPETLPNGNIKDKKYPVILPNGNTMDKKDLETLPNGNTKDKKDPETLPNGNTKDIKDPETLPNGKTKDKKDPDTLPSGTVKYNHQKDDESIFSKFTRVLRPLKPKTEYNDKRAETAKRIAVEKLVKEMTKGETNKKAKKSKKDKKTTHETNTTDPMKLHAIQELSQLLKFDDGELPILQADGETITNFENPLFRDDGNNFMSENSKSLSDASVYYDVAELNDLSEVPPATDGTTFYDAEDGATNDNADVLGVSYGKIGTHLTTGYTYISQYQVPLVAVNKECHLEIDLTEQCARPAGMFETCHVNFQPGTAVANDHATALEPVGRQWHVSTIDVMLCAPEVKQRYILSTHHLLQRQDSGEIHQAMLTTVKPGGLIEGTCQGLIRQCLKTTLLQRNTRQLVLSLLKSSLFGERQLCELVSPAVWQHVDATYPTCVQDLLNEIKIVQQSIFRYHLQFKALDVKIFTISNHSTQSEQDRSRLATITEIKRQISEEISHLEEVLTTKLSALCTVQEADGEMSFKSSLSRLHVIPLMLELLKEQVYQSSVLYSLQNWGDDKESESMVPQGTGSGAILEHLADLHKQLQQQEEETSQLISHSLHKLRSSLIDEIRSCTLRETSDTNTKL